MTPLLVVLALGCDPAPAALPPPQQTQAIATGGKVHMGRVRGFLARPSSREGLLPGVLLLVEADGETAQRAALGIAEAGSVVLAIAPDVPEPAARAYLEGMPATDPARIQTDCRRAACP